MCQVIVNQQHKLTITLIHNNVNTSYQSNHTGYFTGMFCGTAACVIINWVVDFYLLSRNKLMHVLQHCLKQLATIAKQQIRMMVHVDILVLSCFSLVIWCCV